MNHFKFSINLFRKASSKKGLDLLAFLFFPLVVCPSLAGKNLKEPPEQAKETIFQCIDAMGAEKYLAVKTEYVKGRDFFFKKNRRSGLIPFQSWTHYRDPVRHRHQIFKGKKQKLLIINLELDKGWTQEGLYTIEEMPRDRLQRFKKSVKQDLHYFLRNRLEEEGISFFYYDRTSISGSGKIEAVEIVDKTNDTLTIYFDIKTHLPVHTESVYTDKIGLRHKVRIEFFNWHEMDGVLTPLSLHYFEDGEKSQERFLESVIYNTKLSPDYFLEPRLSPKQARKAKKEKQ